MRVHHVNSARKSKNKRTCRHCGHVVEPKESYKWAEPRYGGMMYWCKDHYPKRSELTSSKMGSVYDAQDEFDVSEAKSTEEISEALTAVAEAARSAAEEYQEGIDNMPEGLQEGQVAEESREKIDALEAYADELENWVASDVEEFDADTAREEAEKEVLQDMVTEMMENSDAPHPPMVENEDSSVFDVDEVTVDWIKEHGDEADFSSRVDALMSDKEAEWKAEHSDDLDGAREEAQQLVDGLEY